MKKSGSFKHGIYSLPYNNLLRRTHQTWKSMLQRCKNPVGRNKAYKNVSVCSDWLIFDNFLADMGIRPSNEVSLDRINSNLGYNKENCRWASKLEQRLNCPTRIINITYLGETKCLREWARHLGLGYHFIYSRLKRGLTFHEAVTKSKYYTEK